MVDVSVFSALVATAADKIQTLLLKRMDKRDFLRLKKM